MAGVALGIAVVALRRSDLNSSAAMIVAMNQGFADSWRQLVRADPDHTDHEFAELLNSFEIAAAIHQEGSVRGVAKELLEDYLCRALSMFNEDEGAKQMVAALRDTPTTFRYVILFLKAMKKSGRTDGIETLVDAEPRWSE